jgi:DNA-binding Lrp family transcriptional regulator
MKRTRKPNKMDEKDLRILDILSTDSRTSFVEIGRVLGLSEGAVRKRISDLIHDRTIRRFTIETTLPSLNALILISTKPEVPNPQISKDIATIDGVSWVYETTGQYDIAVLVSGTDIAFINGCIDKIRSIEGVNHTNTLIILRQW